MPPSHEPLPQIARRPAGEQACPQPPQLAVSAFNPISQPSARLSRLQSPHPASHAPLQTLPAQEGLAMWLFEQMRKQAPQLRASLPVGTSQPSDCILPLQSEKPASQVPVQDEFVQAGVEWFFEQPMAQPPQLVTSF